MKDYSHEFDDAAETVLRACKISEKRGKVLFDAAWKLYKDYDRKSETARAILEIETIDGEMLTDKERVVLCMMTTWISTRIVVLKELAECEPKTVEMFGDILRKVQKDKPNKPNAPEWGGRLGKWN
jgi:ABC-type taurine transport system substrate-binding protein